MSALTLEHLSKRYGEVAAVVECSAAFPERGFGVILGPSGCGKTTVLRGIAGLLRMDSGAIRLGERTLADPVTFVPPERRRIGMVFQDLALWPHMNVETHLRFVLGPQRLPRLERQLRLDEALALVGLGEKRRAFPDQLSGGEQQRVALARALVTRPDLVLLDEPLSNLDEALRRSLCQALGRLQRQVGTPFLMVTHHQEEALAVADHVVVMRAGRVEQQGSPQAVYRHPANAFVASFVAGDTLLSLETLPQAWRALLLPDLRVAPARGVVALRPDSLAPASEDETAIEAVVSGSIFQGTHYVVQAAAQGVSVGFPVSEAWEEGSIVRLACRTPGRIFEV